MVTVVATIALAGVYLFLTIREDEIDQTSITNEKAVDRILRNSVPGTFRTVRKLLTPITITIIFGHATITFLTKTFSLKSEIYFIFNFLVFVFLGATLGALLNVFFLSKKVSALRKELYRAVSSNRIESFPEVTAVDRILNPFSGWDVTCRSGSRVVKVRYGSKNLQSGNAYCLIPLNAGSLTAYKEVLVPLKCFKLVQGK